MVLQSTPEGSSRIQNGGVLLFGSSLRPGRSRVWPAELLEGPEELPVDMYVCICVYDAPILPI